MDYSEMARVMAPALESYFPAFGVDNYGTWTPQFAGSAVGGTFTYATAAGKYARLAGMVLVHGYISITAIGVAPTGSLLITLPFPANTALIQSMPIIEFSGLNLGAGFTNVGGRLDGAGNSYMALVKSGSNIQALFVPGGNLVIIGGSADIQFSGWYFL